MGISHFGDQMRIENLKTFFNSMNIVMYISKWIIKNISKEIYLDSQ